MIDGKNIHTEDDPISQYTFTGKITFVSIVNLAFHLPVYVTILLNFSTSFSNLSFLYLAFFLTNFSYKCRLLVSVFIHTKFSTKNCQEKNGFDSVADPRGGQGGHEPPLKYDLPPLLPPLI